MLSHNSGHYDSIVFLPLYVVMFLIANFQFSFSLSAMILMMTLLLSIKVGSSGKDSASSKA